MPVISLVDLANAKLDVDHIASLATSAALTATDRLGNVKMTWAGLLADLQGQFDSQIQAVTDAKNAAAASATAAAGSATAAAGSATSAAGAVTSATAQANVAATAAATAAAYPNSAASNVPRGLTQASVGAITPGSGGTNGTFALAWTGGNWSTNPVGTFTVAGGVLTAVTITIPPNAPGSGLYIGTSGAMVTPTPSFSASAGLTGAAVVLTPQFLVASGQGYWVQSADAKKLDRYKNVSGVATSDTANVPSIPGAAALSDAAKYAGSVPSKAGVFAGRNLFNPATINSGFIQDATNGTLSANASFFVTDYIPVLPGTQVVSSHATPVGSANAFAYFDYALSYVSGSSAQLAANTPTTVPANAAYIRLTYQNSTTPTASLMICQGSAVPSSYVGYGEVEALPVLTKARSLGLAIRPKRQNLYDPDKAVTGHFINSTTGVSTAGVAFHTDYIPVTAGGQWTIWPASNAVNSPAGLAYYDRNFNFVSGIGGPFTSGQVFTVPAAAWYVRVTGNNSQINTLVILEGSQTPTDAQFHTPAFMSDAWQWHNKQIAILGDSLEDPAVNGTFGRTSDWVTAICAVIGATIGLNAAKSGRTMVDALKTPAGAALTAADFTNIDAVILAIGTNDYGTAATTLGTIADSTATATFYGLTKKAVEQILTWKPTVKFLVCTPTPRNDVTAPNAAGKVLADYSQALRDVANLYRLPICDFEKLSGLNALTFSTFTVDNLHGNNAGTIACWIGPALGFMRTVWPNT
jgi:hypothetical protein